MKWQPFFLLLGLVFFCQTHALWAISLLVDTDVLRVRQQPKGKQIGRVYRGQQFILLEEKKGWGRVEFQHKRQGWISLDYT